MALIEETLFGTRNKVEIAIKRLQSFAPKDGTPMHCAFSGGKDSQCIYHLLEMSGVPFEAHYSVTSVDPPELCRFIKKNYPDVIWDYHYWPDGRKKTMWNVIAAHTIPPTRQARYCCQELKESGGKGRVVVTGVRWAESVRRKENHGIAEIRTTSKKLHTQAKGGDSVLKENKKKNDSIIFLDDNGTARQMVEQCYAKNKTTVNPIVDWTDEDVWEFLNDVAKVPHCELYDPPYNFTRLGCVGCPLQGREGMLKDFEVWPRYKQKYIKAFEKMIENHPGEIKVASGQLAETNGGQQYTQDGSLGTPDFGGSDVQATFLSGEFTNCSSRERERETGRWPTNKWRTNGEETIRWWVENNI